MYLFEKKNLTKQVIKSEAGIIRCKQSQYCKNKKQIKMLKHHLLVEIMHVQAPGWPDQTFAALCILKEFLP